MKSIKVILCSMILMFACSFCIYAKATDSNALDTTNAVLTVEEVNGVQGNSLDEIFIESTSRSAARTPYLSDVIISNSVNEMSFQCALSYNDVIYSINSSGVLYKNEKTSNAGVYQNIILVDMDDTEDFHFVQFRFDKRNSELLIIMQSIESEELLNFSIPLNVSTFNNIYTMSDNSISNEELEKKFIELYSVSGNLIGNEDNTFSYEWESPAHSIDTPLATNATYSGWSGLFKDLEDGTAKLGNHPNVKGELFKGGGHDYDNAWNYPYMVASYSVPNGNDLYLTQITFLDIVIQEGSPSYGKYDVALQLDYREGAIVEYNAYTDILTVVYYDFGLELYEVKVGFGKLTNNAFFINRNLNRRYEADGNLVRAFVSLCAPADVLVNVLDGLAMETYQSANETIYFENTLNSQLVKYGGKIIKGISATSENERLTLPGHLINVAGTIVYDPTLGFSWTSRYEYRYMSYI